MSQNFPPLGLPADEFRPSATDLTFSGFREEAGPSSPQKTSNQTVSAHKAGLMKIALLGTTGYHPNDRRQTACFMLPEQGIVLDAGSGMYRVRDYIKTSTLDIFLTHAHLDHVWGLTFLFDVLHDKQMDRVTVYGEERKLSAIREHLLHPELFPVPLPCEFRPLKGDVSLSGGGKLKYFPLDHPGGSLGFRLDWPGHSAAYVTDTFASPDAPYVEQIRGVDLLIHECYFPDEMRDLAEKTGHSHTTPVAEVARRAGVGRLVLVHVNPLDPSADPIGLDAARAVFPNTQLGVDDVEIEF